MSTPAAKSAIAAVAAALLIGGIAGCGRQSASNDTPAPVAMTIVEQVQIDRDGRAVPPKAVAEPADPAGDGNAFCTPVTIAMAGALTGPDAALGVNLRNGVQLALDTHNAANPGCRITLSSFDTEGDPQKAVAIAPQIVDDAAVIGLIGPAFSGETKATGGVFDQAGLLTATSATNVTLSEQGWRTFLRGLANDGVQGPSVANYLTNTFGDKKICVVDDSTDYGVGLAESVRATLGPVADPACSVSVKKGDKDFSAAVTQIVGRSPDSVFYGGYYSEAALLVTQLREAGFAGRFASGDASKDPEFVKQAGAAADGAVLSCPCGPATVAFADEYTTKFGQAPGALSAEGYDLATILAKGIDSGAVTRKALLDFAKSYDGQGVARAYRWSDNGELASGLIWIYRVQ